MQSAKCKMQMQNANAKCKNQKALPETVGLFSSEKLIIGTIRQYSCLLIVTGICQ